MYHIVTDSSVRFTNAHFAQQPNITIIPNIITIQGKIYRDGIDISPGETLKAIAQDSNTVKILAPTVSDYVSVFTRFIRQGINVVSIHTSRQLSQSWANAREAVTQLAAQKKITIIDSENICAAQGILVKVAYHSAQAGASMEDIEYAVRGAIDRTFSMYCLASVKHLQGNGLFSPSHIILGDFLDIKPFVTLEEGQLKIVEKVKNYAQAIERMVEFVIEFENIEESVLIHNKIRPSEMTHMLWERYTTEFVRQPFLKISCSPTLANLIGPDITGIAILEKEWDVQY